jgi:hypothetical protein
MYSKKEIMEMIKENRPDYLSSDYFFVNYNFKTKELNFCDDYEEDEHSFTIIINPKELSVERAAEFIIRKVNNEYRARAKSEEIKSKNIISMIYNMFSTKK